MSGLSGVGSRFDYFSATCLIAGICLFAAAGAADPAGGSRLAFGMFCGGVAVAGAVAVVYVFRFAVARWRPRRTYPRSRFLAYVLLIGLPCAATSRMPLLSLSIAAGMAGGLFCYYAIDEALSVSHRGFLSQRSLLWGLALCVWILIGGRLLLWRLGFFGEAVLDFSLFTPRGLLPGASRGFAQLYGSMLLFPLPSLAIMAFADEVRPLRFLWALSAGLAACGAALSFSRAAWLALVAQVVAIALLRRGNGGWWALGAAAIGGAIAFFAIPGVSARFATLFDAGHATNIQRLQQWRVCLDLLAEMPFTGHGWGSFGALYAARAGVFYHWPHNLFLHVAAEGGVPALVVFVAWLLELPAMLLRNYGETPEGRQKSAFRDAAVATLAGLLVFGMFDW